MTKLPRAPLAAPQQAESSTVMPGAESGQYFAWASSCQLAKFLAREEVASSPIRAQKQTLPRKHGRPLTQSTGKMVLVNDVSIPGDARMPAKYLNDRQVSIAADQDRRYCLTCTHADVTNCSFCLRSRLTKVRVRGSEIRRTRASDWLMELSVLHAHHLHRLVG